MARVLATFLFVLMAILPASPAFANVDEESTPEVSDTDTSVVTAEEIEEVEIVEEESTVETQDLVEESDEEETVASLQSDEEDALETISTDFVELENEPEDASLSDDNLTEPDVASSTNDVDYEIESELHNNLEEVESASTSVSVPTAATTTPDVTAATSSSGSISVTGDGDIASTTEAVSETDSETNTATEQNETDTSTTTGESVSDESNTETNEQDETDLESDSETNDEIVEVTTDLDTEVSTSTENIATSSVSEHVAAVTESVSYTINDSNLYQFSDKECVSVGDGSFYCTEADVAADLDTDRVYAAPDSEGDYEIFIRKDGVNHKITDNTIDDLAPFYDPISERLVWHALINDRYQIFEYLLDTAELNQITETRFNNMEPSVSGEIIVWQAWVKNSWEVMMQNGDETVQLTDNNHHDIAPHIRNNYIMWQTQDADSWMVSVYDMTAGKTELIQGGAGTQVENPRFVLVYDSKDANGDTHTLGYDLDNKESIQLGSVPAPVPKEIPEPDQTGEIRAIIQKKPTNEDEFELLPIDPENDPPSSDTSTQSATSTDAGDVVVTPFATSTDSLSEEVDTESIVTENVSDIIEDPIATSSIDHIEDVVIPPYNSEEIQ